MASLFSIVLLSAVLLNSWAFGTVHTDEKSEKVNATVIDETHLPFERSPPEGVESMMLLADLKPSTVLYDLGSGDGRIVFAAAAMGVAKAVGVDLDPVLVKQATEATDPELRSRVSFRVEDFTETDLRDATVVTTYWIPHFAETAGPRLFQNLRPGSIILVHDYPIPGQEAAVELISDHPDKVSITSLSLVVLYKYIVSDDHRSKLPPSVNGMSTFVIPHRFPLTDDFPKVEVRYKSNHTTHGSYLPARSYVLYFNLENNEAKMLWIKGHLLKDEYLKVFVRNVDTDEVLLDSYRNGIQDDGEFFISIELQHAAHVPAVFEVELDLLDPALFLHDEQ
jgi:hypothetical protein